MSKETIESFYSAFKKSDGEAMAALYHPEATFGDPVFQHLNANEACSMWKMLIEKSQGNLKIEFHSIEASEDAATCIWEAWYNFSKTKRPVHNVIRAKMEFKDGLIIKHQDEFDLWKWSRMALGVPGALLGWTPFLKNKIRNQAADSLDKYLAHNP